jgi:hypothetical protein
MMAILGLFSERKKTSLTLGILCFLGYMVIPRGGVDLLTLYLPLLATIGFRVITEPWNNESLISQDNNQFPAELKSKRARTIFFFIFVYMFLGAFTYKYVYNKSNLRLNDNNFEAMEWLGENTNISDEVLLIPLNQENRYWWNDFISEWLPALSGRKSIATVQGYEWKPNEFEERILLYTSLRNCNGEYDCIKTWERDYKIVPDFIYLDDLTILKNLSEDILDSSSYSIVFENKNVMILKNINR